MQSKRREFYLKIGVAVVVGLFLADRFVITPGMEGWKAQTERLADLREKVNRGRQLLEREKSLRDRWQEMIKTDLPADDSAAENNVFQAISRWARESNVTFTNLTPQWRKHDEGYETFEFRANANGDQASLARLLYEIEQDPLPARIESYELNSRDGKGRQLTLALKVSLVRLDEGGAN